MKNARFVAWIALACAALVTLPAGGAQAWWDAKWSGRMKVVLNTSSAGADVKDTVSDVSVLVRLHTGNFDFAAAKEDGSDIRFVSADDKAPLKHHIEKYDPKQGIALLWVRVPQITGGNSQNTVWLYFGNGAVQDAQDPGGTFDTPQALVLHFAETEGIPRDATGYGNHSASFQGKQGVPSAVGNGIAFGSPGDNVVVKPSASLSFAKGFSVSAWVKIDGPQKNAYLLSREQGGDAVVLGIEGTKPYLGISSGRKSVRTKPGGEIAPNRWHHLAAVAEGGRKLVVYVDGKEVSSAAAPAKLPELEGDLLVGAAAKGGHAFSGELDELRISSVARSAAWFLTEAASMGQDGKLAAVQPAETGKSGGSDTIHLMKVVVRTITLDGWVIIGVLGLLGVWATYIFLGKFQYLQRTFAGNADFTEKMRATTHPLDLEIQEGEFDDSSIFRVYLAGCEELSVWHTANEDRGPSGKIPNKVAESIQAALNKASIHESRKMSAGLNILMLCISGGPFLGLLGTVWGVINTFAGLAEAGEANLSAIAPGVASALACTLAGLLVAIPSLFAYSDLTVKIKEITADTYLFIDEFLIKIRPDEEAA